MLVNFKNPTCRLYIRLYRGILVMATLVMSTVSKTLPDNQLVGIKYISYDNFDGTLATGDCCDEPGKKAGFCTPDLCDTVFEPCGSSSPMQTCDVFQAQKTPVTYNNNTFLFGSRIGNGPNTSTHFLVLKFPFIKGDINFNFKAYEAPDIGLSDPKKDIAEFSFAMNWVDPIYKNPPIFRRQVLNDTRARLVLDIVSQCSKHYYGQYCSVYCQPDGLHYTCLDNGTIDCLPGWMSSKCTTMVDYCPGNVCQHGSTCVPVLLNYTCTCTPDFTGRYCETSTTTTSIPTTTPQTTTTSTSTTPRLTTTTVAATTLTSTSPQPLTTIKTTTITTTPTTTSTTTAPSTTLKLTTTATTTTASTSPTQTTTASTIPPKRLTTAATMTTTTTNHSRYNMSSGSDDDNEVVPIASGAAGGFLFLLAIVGAAYYVMKKKKNRPHVVPDDEKPPLDHDEDQISTSQTRPKNAYDVHVIEVAEEKQRIEMIRESLDAW